MCPSHSELGLPVVRAVADYLMHLWLWLVPLEYPQPHSTVLRLVDNLHFLVSRLHLHIYSRPPRSYLDPA